VKHWDVSLQKVFVLFPELFVAYERGYLRGVVPFANPDYSLASLKRFGALEYFPCHEVTPKSQFKVMCL
jgi:hypothetical protein